MPPTLTTWHVISSLIPLTYGGMHWPRRKRKQRPEVNASMTYNASFVGSKQDAHQMQVIPESHVETGMFEMQIEGQETSEKMGCLPLLSHPTCAVGFTNPAKYSFFSSLDGDQIRVRLFLVAQNVAKGAVLGQSTVTAIMAVRSEREECRRCSVAEMIGWQTGALLRLCSAELCRAGRDVVLTMCISVTLSSVYARAYDFPHYSHRTWNGTLTGMHHAKTMTDNDQLQRTFWRVVFVKISRCNAPTVQADRRCS